MAYKEYLTDRIRHQLKEKHIGFDELKMMGELCFKVNNKMLCGIHIDKKHGDSLLMARIGESVYRNELKKTGMLDYGFYRPPHERVYFFLTAHDFDTEVDLSYWLDVCLAFNPMAKAG